MPRDKEVQETLPSLRSKRLMNYFPSELERLSSELHTISHEEKKPYFSVESKRKVKKLWNGRAMTESKHSEIRQCKDKLEEIRTALNRKQTERSQQISDKIKRIQSLACTEVSRNSNNFFLTPPSPMQYPMPMMPPFPFMAPPGILSPYGPYGPYAPMSPYPPAHEMGRGRENLGRYRMHEEDESEYQKPQRLDRLREAGETRRGFKPPPKKKKQHRKLRSMRKYAWAVLFAVWLPKYSERIRKARQNMLKQFESRNFNVQMLMFQRHIVKKIKSFFFLIYNKKNTSLVIERGEKLVGEKIQTVRKLISILIEGLSAVSGKQTNPPGLPPIQIIHLFCRHGSFICNSLTTKQQLNLLCISQKHGYLRMDKNLEKAQIINFVIVKILLYNILLNPEKVDKERFSRNDVILTQNFYFVSSIFYELCLEVQDNYMCKVPAHNYQLGNWKQYRKVHKITPAQSLAYQNRPLQEDELISGLLGAVAVHEIFGKQFWHREKVALQEAIELLHLSMVKCHREVKNKIN